MPHLVEENKSQQSLWPLWQSLLFSLFCLSASSFNICPAFQLGFFLRLLSIIFHTLLFSLSVILYFTFILLPHSISLCILEDEALTVTLSK